MLEAKSAIGQSSTLATTKPNRISYRLLLRGTALTGALVLLALQPLVSPALAGGGSGGATTNNDSTLTLGGAGGADGTAGGDGSHGNNGGSGGGGGGAGGGAGGTGGIGSGGCGGSAGAAGCDSVALYAGAGGGGGGNGGNNAHQISGLTSLTVSGATSAGGDGGNGGAGGNSLATAEASAGGGGGGGAGGNAFVIGAGDLTLRASGVANGGNGGAGGIGGRAWIGHGGNGGYGGDGGSGAYFTVSGQTFTNAGAVQGGNGGAGGAGGMGISSDGVTAMSGVGGAGGAGGAGVVGSNLTVINTGSIGGGLSVDGLTRADAITFRSGSNSLTNSGTLTGNLGIVSGVLTLLQTGGSASYANVVTGAGSVTVTTSGGNSVTLSGANTYSGGTTVTEGSTLVIANSDALGSGAVTLTGGTTGVTLNFSGSLTLANAIAATGDPTYNVQTGNTVTLSGVLSGTGDVVVNGGTGYAGTLVLSGTNTYSGPTTVAAGTLKAGSASAFGNNSATTVASGATLDLGGFSNAVGSLAGAGTVTNGGGSSVTLTAGGDNSSTVFSGVIQDGTGTTTLTKTGTGKLTLSGTNSYTGATTVSAGTLQVDGSIANSGLTTVAGGATLTGSGTLGNTIIASGGNFAAGSGTAGTSTTVVGNLTLQSGSTYAVQISPSSASSVTVSGTATLAGTASATFSAGSYVNKSYDLLHAGSVSGSFASLTTASQPAGFSSSLRYTATDVYLDLQAQMSMAGMNDNQTQVGSSLKRFFDNGGTLPAGFATVFGLSGATQTAALGQLSGETATGNQRTTTDVMNRFVNRLSDPSIEGRGGLTGGSGGGLGYGEEDDGASARPRSERDAYAMITRAAHASFDARWSVWASGYGGTQTTDGNATTGSSSTTSRIYGVVAGADVALSPSTTAGFALGGGGTNYSIVSSGTGRSDLFQAGGFIRHSIGPAYLAGTLAYGWQDVTTDRTVTVAGADHLQARFSANAYSGRAEAGYRVATPWLGVTPYAAAQVTVFQLPAYVEQVLSGTNNFALSYDARTSTATRSELGLRGDKAFLLDRAVLTLRGRAAWAHDYNIDGGVSATFQALQGASFVVNGATPARDGALTTASAEIAWPNGVSVTGTFDGEFSSNTRSYIGRGVVRYSW